MHPLPSRPVAPVSRLASAILEQAVSDLRNLEAPPSLRADAMRFIVSENFLLLCRVMRAIDPDAAREKLLRDGG